MGANLSPNHLHDDKEFPPLAEINVTPFVDVMLVLLIIFMVTAPLMLAGVKIDMHETTAARQNPPQKRLVVSISADNGIYIRKEAVDRQGLVARLSEIRNAKGDTVAYIRADKSLSYGLVMDILGDVAAAGYDQISLLSERKSSVESN